MKKVLFLLMMFYAQSIFAHTETLLAYIEAKPFYEVERGCDFDTIATEHLFLIEKY